MRKFYLLLSVLFVSVITTAQTTLINSTFETGDATAWSFANSTPNAWVIGSAVAAEGSRSVYISNDNGNTNAYAPGVSTVSHIYKSVNFPTGQGAILLSFDIKGIGEPGPITYDYVRVSLTTAAPVAGTMPATANQLPIYLSAYTSFNRVWVSIPAVNAGTTKNLVFTFRSANTQGSTAFALDNVRLTSAVAAALSGTKTIKPSGGTYGSFSEAIANVNAHGVGGALIFSVDAGTTFNETPTAIIVGGTTADITFQKAGTGVNPKIIATGTGNNQTLSTGDIGTSTSPVTNAVMALAGADRIVFDGIDFASANYQSAPSVQSAIEYGVYVYNASATNGAQNNVIRNSAITLNRTDLATRGILQRALVTPTSAAGANSTNKYYNLTITNTFAGIELQGGSSTTNPDLANEVGTTDCSVFNTIGAAGTANDIGNGAATTWGIKAVNQSGVKIFNNRISNVTTTASGALSPVDGILIDNFFGTNEVYNNRITGITAANGGNTSSASGINLAHATSGTHTIRVYNNFVSGITHGYSGTATADRYIKGIFVSGVAGSASQTYAIDYNSVRIDGSSSPNTSSTALEVSTTSGPVYLIRNNILSNFTSAQSGVARHFSIVSPSFQRVGASGSTTTYNDLYVANATNGFVAGGGIDATSTTFCPTVACFQSSFNDNNTLANNLSVNPGFVSVTDLHSNAAALNGTASPTYLSASPWVTKDIDCETRPALTDIGADDFASPTAICATPSNPTSLTFTGITASDATGGFTAPLSAPTGYIVVLSNGALSASPVNGTSYAVDGALGNGTVVAVGAATTFSVTKLTANTAYTITVFPFNNTSCTNGPVYNTSVPLTGAFTTCPATPASPSVVSASSNDFVLSFTSSNAGGAIPVTYSLEVASDAGFTAPVSGSPFTFPDNSVGTTVTYTVTGLNPSTQYYYRLKANGCNGNAVTGTAATLCGPVTVPYTESFESITSPNTLPVCMTAWPLPLGLKTLTYTTAATGTNLALSARTGTKFAAVSFSPRGPGYFFSVPLQLTGGVSYTASVYYKTDGVAWPLAGLVYGKDATPAAMTETIVTATNAAATTYTQLTGTFTPASTGVYYVSFFADNSATGSSPNYVAFDDFSVEAGIACSAPVATAATAITPSGATLNWTAPALAPASYEVYYSTSNAAPSGSTTPTITGVTGTTRTLTSLAPATTYYAWVRSNCGAGGSAWSAVTSFTTLCTPVNVPYTENFDGATLPDVPACTTKEDANKDGSTWTTVTAPAGYSGKTLQYASNASNAADDWFYTTGLNLTAGTSYTLTFKYGNSISGRFERLKVAYGNSPGAGAMTNTLQNYTSISGSTATNATLTFSPSTTGVYYIGFQAYSNANESTLYLDDITVAGALTTPANDEATGAFTLTVGAGCSGAAYTNVAATKSAAEVYPSCSGTGQAPVWFKFVATSAAVRVSTDVGVNNTLTDSKVALFSASNPADYSTFNILSCDDDNGSALSGGNMSVLYATDLTVGNTYYIAVDKASAATASGTFCIAVDNLSASMLSTNTQCAAPLQKAASGNTDYAGQVSLVDGDSKLIAIVKNSTGESPAAYTPAVIVSPVQRQWGGLYYLNRNYSINNASSKTPAVQLFFLASELAGLNALDGSIRLSSLSVTRQVSAGCQADFSPLAGLAAPLVPTSNGTTGDVDWLDVNLPPGVSNLYLNRAGATLPVNLLSFSGQRQGANNVLKWTVEGEQDLALYQVERSGNNRDWTTAGTINAIGNAAGRLSYSFTDNNVQGLKQYYRLRQVDRNGAAKLSNTVVISGPKAAVLGLSGLFPNPAAQQVKLIIETPVKDNLTIMVMDAVGKVVKAQKVYVEAGSNTVLLNVVTLSQGSYLVKVTAESSSQTAVSKFVKE